MTCIEVGAKIGWIWKDFR